MMAGMTGAGKSLMVNNIVNFVYGVNCEDDFRFKLVLEVRKSKKKKCFLSSIPPKPQQKITPISALDSKRWSK